MHEQNLAEECWFRTTPVMFLNTEGPSFASGSWENAELCCLLRNIFLQTGKGGKLFSHRLVVVVVKYWAA